MSSSIEDQLEVEITLPTGEAYLQPIGLFINNEFVPSQSKAKFETFNPTTSKSIVSIYEGLEEDVNIAVKIATKTFYNVWNKTNHEEKAKIMNNFADLIDENAHLLAKIESMDSGKPYQTNSINDIYSTSALVRYYAGWIDKSKSNDKLIHKDEENYAYTIDEPFGVVGQIIPWNYPISMAGWKFAPALAAGNCIIMKTAENTPLSMLYLAKLVKEAGFPAGVFNILSGFGNTCGAAIASHLKVRKIAFTGSTLTGQIVQKLASSNLKAVTLECGGKSPLLVFPDANIEKTIEWASFGIMYNMGQNCTANSRIYVHESIYEKFIKEFADYCENNYKIGDPFDEKVQIGPLISKLQQEKVLKYIESGIKEGARLIIGGKAPTTSPLSDGYYVEPTIFADVTEDMTIMKEEIFGPVAAIAPFKTEEEVVEKANNSEYGLAAMIFTKDMSRAHRLARTIEAGSVYLNCSNNEDQRVPFGGVKMSGFGRELGEWGFSEYTQTKAVHVNLT